MFEPTASSLCGHTDGKDETTNREEVFRLLAGMHGDTIASKENNLFFSPPAISLTHTFSLSTPLDRSLCFYPVTYGLNDHVPWHESAIQLTYEISAVATCLKPASVASSGGSSLPSSGHT